MIRFSCSLNFPWSEWGLDPTHINCVWDQVCHTQTVCGIQEYGRKYQCTMYQYTMYYAEGTCNRTWETRLQTAWCSRWHLFLPTQATCEIKAAHTQSHITLSSLHEYVTLYPSVFHSSVRCQVAAAIQTVVTAEEMRWQAKIMEWEEKHMCVFQGFSDTDVNHWPKFCYLLFIH